MKNPELTDPAAARSCLCPNGHGQMKAVYGPDAPGAPSNWTWECEVCGIERMWPDEDEKAKPAARSRPAPQEHLVELAVEVSGSSPCRSKRGVVIFRGGDVVSHGYNYKSRAFACDGSDACKATCRREAVHAEQQALLSAGTKADGAHLLHVKSVDGKLVSSGGPSCVECSKLALACGIVGVWLYQADGWRWHEMVEFHRLSLEAELAALAAARLACQQEIEQLKDRLGAERALGHGIGQEHTIAAVNAGGVDDLIAPRLDAARAEAYPAYKREKALRCAAEAARTALRQQYDELIYAVGNKYPNESRHQTALRYIRQAETHEGSATAKASDLADRLARAEQK